MNETGAPDNSSDVNDIHLAEVINMMAEACIDYPEMPFDFNIFYLSKSIIELLIHLCNYKKISINSKSVLTVERK